MTMDRHDQLVATMRGESDEAATRAASDLIEMHLDSLLGKRGLDGRGKPLSEKTAMLVTAGLFDEDARVNLDLIVERARAKSAPDADWFGQVKVPATFDEGDRQKLAGVRNLVGGRRKAFIGFCQVMAGALEMKAND